MEAEKYMEKEQNDGIETCRTIGRQFCSVSMPMSELISSLRLTRTTWAGSTHCLGCHVKLLVGSDIKHTYSNNSMLV